MSFSDPVKVIDHIPKDIDMKVRSRKRPLAQRQAAKLRKQQEARQNVEPFCCEKTSTVWKVVAFVGALAIVVAALIQGTWK